MQYHYSSHLLIDISMGRYAVLADEDVEEKVRTVLNAMQDKLADDLTRVLCTGGLRSCKVCRKGRRKQCRTRDCTTLPCYKTPYTGVCTNHIRIYACVQVVD
jgi:hypothetical protein